MVLGTPDCLVLLAAHDLLHHTLHIATGAKGFLANALQDDAIHVGICLPVLQAVPCSASSAYLAGSCVPRIGRAAGAPGTACEASQSWTGSKRLELWACGSSTHTVRQSWICYGRCFFKHSAFNSLHLRIWTRLFIVATAQVGPTSYSTCAAGELRKSVQQTCTAITPHTVTTKGGTRTAC